MSIMQFLDPNLFVDRVNVFEEDSVKPPILEVFPDIPDLVSNDIWDAFSDFSRDVLDFSLTVDEFNGGALPEMPRLVESDSKFLDDGEDISSLPDDSAVSSTADGAPT